MNDYTPELITFALSTLQNIVLIIACSYTTIQLFKLSRSWWSLLALLMLLGLSMGSFIRD